MDLRFILVCLYLLVVQTIPGNAATCPAHGEDPNRYIEDSEIENVGSYETDDWIWFSCNEGYTLRDDEEEITCDENGQWDPVDNPRCLPETCAKPPPPRNCTLNGPEVTPFGGTLEVTCDAGFEIEGRATLECIGARGTKLGWDREISKCRPVVCPGLSLVTLENGRLVMTSNRIGGMLTAYCQDGYELYGPTTRNCTASGCWSGPLQICRNGKSLCPDPGTPVAGYKEGTSYNKGDEVKFGCEFDRVMFGSANRTCLGNGQWSGEETRCMGRREAMSPDYVTLQMSKIIHGISKEVKESEDIYKEMKEYENKPVIFGDKVMNMVTLNGRTSLNELRSSEGLDLYFFIDNSASIKKKDMDFTGIFIKQLVDRLGVGMGRGSTRVSLVAFNNTVWRYTLPTASDSAATIKTAVDEIVSAAPRGGTNLESAFVKFEKVLIPDAKKANGGRNVPSAIVIITDGLSNIGRSPVQVAREIRRQYGESQMEFYLIGVGDANKELLKEIATAANKEVKPENLIFVKDRQTLDIIMTLVDGDKDYSTCGIGGITGLSNGVAEARAKPGAWPWMSAVFFNENAKKSDDLHGKFHESANKHVCGASLFFEGGSTKESKYLLSAAHCYAQTPDPHKYTVKFGSTTILKGAASDESERVIMNIKRIYSHKSYDASSMANDIAILELESPVKYRSDIRPVCLPHPAAIDEYKTSKVGIVTGWGRTSHEGESSTHLKQLHVAVQDIVECRKNITVTHGEVDERWNFCAGGLRDEDGKIIDACKGDSGGPLVMWKEDKDSATNIFTQTGIVSFGEKCKQSGKPGVYTRLSKYVNWIDDTVECLERHSNKTIVQLKRIC